MTLYRNFASKDELILAFLDTSRGALDARLAAVRGGGARRQPGGRLLAIFDVFGEWFEREDFEGCSFINVMLEVTTATTRCARRASSTSPRSAASSPTSPSRRACPPEDADAFARQWHILMKGSIVAAARGRPRSPRQAGA